jgi:hypothetical protein
LKRKQVLQIITGSLSTEQPPQSGLYLGNKINKSGKSFSAHGGAVYTKRQKDGCGCGGKVVRQKGGRK